MLSFYTSLLGALVHCHDKDRTKKTVLIDVLKLHKDEKLMKWSPKQNFLLFLSYLLL